MGCGSSTPAAPPLRDRPAPRPPARGDGRIRLPPPWDMEGGPITESQLAMKRQSFWETQTSGRREVWETLRLVCESILAGNVELASTVMDSADLRGDLACVYDAMGASYSLPRYVYSTPRNIASERDMAVLTSRPKGAPVAGPAHDVAIILRMSATASSMEQDVKLTVRSDERVSDLKRRLHEHLSSGASDQVRDASTPKPNLWRGRGLPPARQRMMCRGRELGPDITMDDAGVTTGSFIQVFIRPE